MCAQMALLLLLRERMPASWVRSGWERTLLLPPSRGRRGNLSLRWGVGS